MLIFAIIPIVFIIFSYKNFKLAFFTYIAFKMLAVSAMCVRYSPPALSVETILNVFFIFEFFRRGYYSLYKQKNCDYPFKRYTIFSLLSITISATFSILPFGNIINSVIIIILDNFLLPFMFWILISEENDLIIFIRRCIIVFIFSCGFGIFEFITRENIFVDFLYNNVPEELLNGKLMAVGERGDLPRITSLFVSPNNFIYGGFISLMIYYFNSISKDRIRYFVCFFLCTSSLVIMANSRTVLISFLLLALPIYLNVYNDSSRKIILISSIIIIMLSPYLAKYLPNILSVISSSSNSEIEGSSVQGRAMQFAGALQLMMKSPIVGNGLGSIEYYLENGWKWIILGTESIWMKLMIERGIIGIISYLFLFFDFYRIMKPLNRITLFMLFGYLVAHTMSSLPGFNISFFMITIITMDYINKLTKNTLQ